MILSLTQVNSHAVLVVGVAIALATVMLIGAWIAWPLFVIPGLLWLVLVGYMASRWPLAMLVTSALMVLADPVLVRTVLPDSMDLGPIGASEPMLAVTGLVIAVNALRRGTFWTALRDPLLPLMVLFVAVAVVSAAANATPPRVALLGIVMTVDAIAVYFLARMVPLTERKAWLAVSAVVAVALVAAFIGILQVLLHPDLFGFASFAGRFGEGGRITSFLGNPNMVAAVIGASLPFPLLAARRLEASRDRWISFAVVTIFALALLLTFSRGAWLAVLVGALVTILFLDRRTLLTLAMAIAIAWLVTIVMPRNLLVARADLPLYFPESGAPSIIDSTLDRLDAVYERRDLRMRFIREGIPIIVDNPLLGVGPGRYGGAASAIVPSPVYEEYGTGLYGFRTVHNFWLHLYGEVGAVGGAIFVVAILGLWIRLVKNARATLDPRRFVLLAGTATAVSVVTLNNMTEMIFEGNFPGFVIWLVFGLVSTLAPTVGILQRPRASSPASSPEPAARSGD
jgi:putative inorganic carbon (hco3(-)) transporter